MFAVARRAAVARRLHASRALVVFAALVVTCAIDASPALGEEPSLRITSPLAGSFTRDTAPTIAGSTTPLENEEQYFCEVTIKIFAGTSVEATPLQEPTPSSQGACNWLAVPNTPLEAGTYTVAATAQRYWLAEGPEGETTLEKASEDAPPVTFTIDTTAPAPLISSVPSDATGGSTIAVGGSAGSAAGDLPAVTVQAFAGADLTAAPVEAIETQVHDGAWAGVMPGLPPGAYTLRAEQSDSAGNVGLSAPVGLTVVPPAPPAASFTWFPSSPQIGETVSLVSSSTDTESPLTSFAWALGASAPFGAGRPTLSTSFPTAGPHVVRLAVTDAAGRSATATETITVRHQAAALMQPFPVVRIAGRETRSGVRLSLITVTAPVTSRITVRVRGAGVRASSESRVAAVRKPGASTVVVSFPRFARALPAGAVLEVRVTKPGEIGKLTRFIPHRGKLPTRQDTCLSVGGEPMRCPAE